MVCPIAGIGDVMIVVKLGFTALQMLRSAVIHAPSEISDLVRDVEALATVLESTRSVLEAHGDILQQPQDVKCITAVFRGCEETLEGLRTIADEYGQVLRASGAPPSDEASRRSLWESTLRNSFLRLKWQITADTTAQLRTYIDRHFNILNVVLGNLQMFAPCP